MAVPPSTNGICVSTRHHEEAEFISPDISSEAICQTKFIIGAVSVISYLSHRQTQLDIPAYDDNNQTEASEEMQQQELLN